MLKYLLALLILSIIIFVHEFGHFILAKASGVKVVEFSIGMGPRLIKFTRNGTMYSLKLFLFGGSCQMLGDDFETLPEPGEDKDIKEEKSAESASDGSYNNASVWRRIAIGIAGPLANFILAFVGAVILIGVEGYAQCVIHSVKEDTPAYEAGLQAGDRIVEINGKNIVTYGDYNIYEMFYEGEKLDVVVERDGKEVPLSFKPEWIEEDKYLMGVYMQTDVPLITEVIDKSPAKKAGIKAGDLIYSVNGDLTETHDKLTAAVQKHGAEEMEVVVIRDDEKVTLKVTPEKTHNEYYELGYTISGQIIKAGPITTIKYAFYEVGYWIRVVFASFRMLFTGVASVNDLSGPVGIVSVMGEVVESSKAGGVKDIVLNLLNFTVMISANLGVMNLLPLPALDGGRLLFQLIEVVRGKPVPKEKEGMIHFVGIILLLLLSVVVLVNDIRKLFM